MPLFKPKKDPNRVFTPRSTEVNPKMYISRPNLEEELERKMMGSKHVLIHGESGCGKSWLYKKVLSDMKIEWLPINLANTSRHSSITDEFNNTLARIGKPQKTGYSEKIYSEANAVVAKGGADHTNNYILHPKEPVEACLEILNHKSKGELGCVVLDNLESIYENKDLMDELGSILILLDDENYAKYNVKFLVVGVPSGVMQYFSSTRNLHTIKNRLSEIPEVSKLNKIQTEEFVKIGLIDELDIKFDSDELYALYKEHIFWVTNGVPQSLHEYCLELSYLCKNNSYIAKKEFLLQADKMWLRESFTIIYSAIANMLNSRETKVSRRNQVLYCLGLLQKNSFKTIEVEEILKSTFPTSAKNTVLNVGQTLSNISEFENTFIKRTVKGDSWFFTNNQYVLCLRLMLCKTVDEKVEKIDYNDIYAQ